MMLIMDRKEIESLLLLGLVRGLGPTLTRRCVEEMGSAEAVLGASVGQLSGVQGIGSGKSRSIVAGIEEELRGDRLKEELELVHRYGVKLIGIGDEVYPRMLKHIPDPPMLLYVRGDFEKEDALGLGIVGARKCTSYGREQADRFAVLCSQAGLCIVSGGAYGVDAAAHQAVLRGKGRTIAVIGSGHAEPYPREHCGMFDEIAGGRGAVVSEFGMTVKPMAENFPRRNRIISGMSLGILVVEAAERSGALITARLAAEDHGREVMALPGRIDSYMSAGCHKMIREGWARLVCNAGDVLDSLGAAGDMLKGDVLERGGRDFDGDFRGFQGNRVASGGGSGDNAGAGAEVVKSKEEIGLSENQSKIVNVLIGRMAMDAICEQAGLTVGAVMADITMLEIRGSVRRVDGLFERVKQTR